MGHEAFWSTMERLDGCEDGLTIKGRREASPDLHLDMRSWGYYERIGVYAVHFLVLGCSRCQLQEAHLPILLALLHRRIHRISCGLFGVSTSVFSTAWTFTIYDRRSKSVVSDKVNMNK